MGVLNVTPDSFSDGGRYNRLDAALVHAERMVADGAAIVDIGGESTRPYARPVTEIEELERVMPVLEGVRGRLDVAISIDTSAPTVIREATAAGAVLINDVRALRQPGALDAAAACNAAVCLMHMQGEPPTMQSRPAYDDPVADIADFLRERLQAAEEAGIAAERLVVDPGFGFGKSLRHNLELLRGLARFRDLDRPLLVGLSRKSMLGSVTGRDVGDRLAASIAAGTVAMLHGACIVRAHDVAASVDAARLVAAILGEPGDSP